MLQQVPQRSRHQGDSLAHPALIHSPLPTEARRDRVVRVHRPTAHQRSCRSLILETASQQRDRESVAALYRCERLARGMQSPCPHPKDWYTRAGHRSRYHIHTPTSLYLRVQATNRQVFAGMLFCLGHYHPQWRLARHG